MISPRFTMNFLIIVVLLSLTVNNSALARRSDVSTPGLNLKPPLLTDPRGRIQYKTTYACEGKQLDLSCDEGRIIHLVRANYGRFSLSICNPTGQLDLSVNCMSFRSFLIMQDRCSQASNCSVVVSSKIFGDPCPGTSKYLEVQYHCVHPNAADPVSVMTVMPPSSSPLPPNFASSVTKKTGDSDIDSKVISETSDMFAVKSETSGIDSSSMTGLKPPYETMSGNGTAVPTASVVPSTTLFSPSTTASTSSLTTRGSNVARMSSSQDSVPGFKAVPQLPSSHHHSSHHSHRQNRPAIPSDIFRQPIPPRPEISLPPWLESDPSVSPPTKDEGIFVFSPGSPDGRSHNHPTTGFSDGSPSSSGSESYGSEADGSSSSPSNPMTSEEDDDMILMAVALFFIVFFLVMGTFGLIYCIIRSDSVRSRKFVRQIPFIHCLFGPDSLGSNDLDSNVEKVSSVVQSSAYGSTSLSSQLHHHHLQQNFVPIVGTRVPTQITSMDSPTSSTAKFMTLQQQHQNLSQNQTTSPVRPPPITVVLSNALQSSPMQSNASNSCLRPPPAYYPGLPSRFELVPKDRDLQRQLIHDIQSPIYDPNWRSSSNRTTASTGQQQQYFYYSPDQQQYQQRQQQPQQHQGWNL